MRTIHGWISGLLFGFGFKLVLRHGPFRHAEIADSEEGSYVKFWFLDEPDEGIVIDLTDVA